MELRCMEHSLVSRAIHKRQGLRPWTYNARSRAWLTVYQKCWASSDAYAQQLSTLDNSTTCMIAVLRSSAMLVRGRSIPGQLSAIA